MNNLIEFQGDTQRSGSYGFFLCCKGTYSRIHR